AQSDRAGSRGNPGVLRTAHVQLPGNRVDVPGKRRRGRGAVARGARRIRAAHVRRPSGPARARRSRAEDRGREPWRRDAYGRTHCRAADVNWLLLKPAELLYRGVNRVRRSLYRRGVLRSKRLPVPVISVGNIAMGGGGKTPTVIAIARALSERGMRVGVLTRGYGRSGAGGVVDAPDAARFGDEPVLIKKSAPNVDVIVGANR